MATCYLNKTEQQFWEETSPRMLVAQLEEYRRIETERAVFSAIAFKIDNPYKLIKQEVSPISNDEAWDNWGR